MTGIYEHFDRAFSGVSAYAVTRDGVQVGRVCFKYPRNGEGPLWCYVHIWGVQMARGHASGCGYDKHSAAFQSAASAIEFDFAAHDPQRLSPIVQDMQNFPDCGHKWSDYLTGLGYTVQIII